MGIGKACELAGTPRAKMTHYMQDLRSRVGYVSMKIRHIERQAKMFPSLIGLPGEKSSEQEIEGAWAMNEDDSKQTAIILNPIEERDKTIFEQNQLIESLKEVQSKADSLKIELEKTQFDNSIMQKKLIFTRKATEERIFENMLGLSCAKLSRSWG